MVQHGDDTYRYKDIRANFSSNVYNGFDHSGLMQHLRDRISLINSYPEPDAETLEKELAEVLGIGRECLMVTNGATEAIHLIAQAFADHESVIPQPTFGEYREAVMKTAKFSSVPPQEERLLPQMVWLCNPNNPTGRVQNIHYDADKLYVVDQSYDCFTEHQLLSTSEAVSMPNVLLLHSMTKEYAIPGLRLGYVVGNAHLIEKVRKLRISWSVNALAIEAGRYLLRHKEDYVLPLQMLLSERERVANALIATGYIDVEPSDTHILLCRLHDSTATELKEYLATKCGILIRDASNFETLTPQHFRIAVQQPELNDLLITSLLTFIEGT